MKLQSPKRRRPSPQPGGAAAHRRVVARVQLPVGRDDLPARQPAAPRAADDRTRPSCCWDIGGEPGAVVRVGPLERLIVKYVRSAFFVAGPGHVAPGVLGPAYSKRTSEVCPDKSEDAEGLRKFFKQFSSPSRSGRTSRQRHPGRSMKAENSATALSRLRDGAQSPISSSRASSATARRRRGRSPAWPSNKFINPIRDGAVLPILNLNGYKIANPTIWRASATRSSKRSSSAAATTIFVEGSDPDVMRRRWRRRWTRRWARFEQCSNSADDEDAVPAALAGDRVAVAERLDRTQGDQGPQGRRLVAIPQVLFWTSTTTRRICNCSKIGRSYKSEEFDGAMRSGPS